MPWTRASELDRTLICPGSLILPRTEVKSERALEAADWGTLVHRWSALGQVIAEPGRVNHARLFQERLDATGIVRETYWPAGGRHEVSVAVNILTFDVRSAHIPSKAEQDAWKGSFDDRWVTGTIDYLGSLMGQPWVDDLKTGAWPVSEYTWQLDFYGLAAALLVGATEDIRVSITQWPRYPKAGLPTRIGRSITADDRAHFSALLVERRVDYLTARDSCSTSGSIPIDHLVPGEHCRWCPSRNECPEYDETLLTDSGTK